MHKNLIKLRDLLRYQYASIHGLYREKKITESDVESYVENFPDIFQILKIRKKEEERKIEEEKFRNIVNLMKPSSEKYLEQLKSELLLVNEARSKELYQEAYTNDEIRQKNNKVSRLDKKLEDIQKTINALQKLIEESTMKRKVGRPKKGEKNETNFE